MAVSGFADAPLTKGLLLLVCLLPLVANLLLLKPYAHLQLVPHVLRHGQYWRLATYQACFTNSSELLLAALLLYNSGRTVERIFGTPKYAAFVLISLALQAALTTGLMIAAMQVKSSSWLAIVLPEAWRDGGRMPGGPFGLVAALVYQHAQLVPDLWLVHFGPFMLGDRALDWLLLVVLGASQGLPTATLSAIGIATSALYASRLPVLDRLRHLRIPRLLMLLAAKVGRPWIGSTRLPQRSSRAEPWRRRTRAQRNAERVARDGPLAASSAIPAGGGGGGGTPGADPGANGQNAATVQFLTGLMRRWSRRGPATPTQAVPSPAGT